MFPRAVCSQDVDGSKGFAVDGNMHRSAGANDIPSSLVKVPLLRHPQMSTYILR